MILQNVQMDFQSTHSDFSIPRRPRKRILHARKWPFYAANDVV